MRNIWVIARREYKLYFATPAAYLVAFMLLLILGVIFYANIVNAAIQQSAPGIDVVLGPMVTLLLFATPALSLIHI